MNKWLLSLATLAGAGTLSLTTIAPASADGAASTRNIIFGAAAAVGLAIEANAAHKNAQANSVRGYLPDGSAVYGDGRVVERGGYAYYPGNNGQSVACNGGACSVYSNSNDSGHWDANRAGRYGNRDATVNPVRYNGGDNRSAMNDDFGRNRFAGGARGDDQNDRDAH